METFLDYLFIFAGVVITGIVGLVIATLIYLVLAMWR